MALCLVVDDEALHREIDAFAMKLAGFETQEAESGQQALEFCSHTTPDIILVDLMMPEMNGLELTSKLRSLPNGAQPFIVICSACTVFGIEEKAKLAGANGFIGKPFSNDLLKNLISQYDQRAKRQARHASAQLDAKQAL